MRHHFKELDSTSKYAKEHINDLNDFDYITCDNQVDGYGVSGNWEGNGHNVYYTLVFRQYYVDEKTFSFIILLSIVDVISKYIDNMYIKLPNDVYHNGKKLSGFIIEKKENSFIIGIGINVHNSPNEFTSLKEKKNQEFDLNTIYEQLTNTIEYNISLNEEDVLKNIKPYIKIIGQKIKYQNKQTLEEFEEICLDLNFKSLKFENNNIEIIKYKELK